MNSVINIVIHSVYLKVISMVISIVMNKWVIVINSDECLKYLYGLV